MQVTVPTLLIAQHIPGATPGTYADGAGDPTKSNGTDQRGVARGNPPCAGAVEISTQANSFTVTFDKNGGDTEAAPTSKTVAPPATTVDALPTPPTRAHYTFQGWNTSPGGGGSAFTASTPVTASFTVYAQWQPITPNISYLPGAPAPEVQNLPADTTEYAGQPYTIPAQAPTRAGYTFNGYTAAGGITGPGLQPGSNFTMPDSDVTLTAEWTALPTYRVDFDSQGGTAVAPYLSVPAGSTIAQPASPTKSGFAFAGLYREAACTTPWNFGTDTVTRSLTLYARWVTPSYQVSYDGNGHDSGSPPAASTVTAGTNYVVKVGLPGRTGHTFAGWRHSVSGNIYQPGDDFVMPWQNVVLVAQWTLINTPPVVPPVSRVTPPASSAASSQAGQSAGEQQPASSLAPPSEPEQETSQLPSAELPTAGITMDSRHWALVNLLLALLTIVVAVVLLITGIAGRKQRAQETEQDADAAENNGQKRKGLLWRILAVLVGPLSIFAFLLTEDLTATMRMVDEWTLLMLALSLLQLVLLLVMRRSARREESKPGDAEAG